jgi:hypothetical protein
MRSAVLLLLAVAPVFSQSNDSKALDTLLSEVRELRLAIERSTLLGARAQLAIGELQLQTAEAARVAQQYADLRGKAAESTSHIAALAERVKQFEEMRTAPEWSTPEKHNELEQLIRQTKVEVEQANAIEQQRSAREAELATQLRNAEAQVADSRSRILAMQQALDAALQQMLKPR